MTKYNVHLFREMRLYYPGIEAESPTEAAKIASETDSGEAEDIEDCNGEDLGALVDVDGNTDFANSELIDFKPQRMLKAAPKLLEALDYLLQQTVDQDLKYGITLSEGEQDARDKALAAIAEATGRAASMSSTFSAESPALPLESPTESSD